MKHEPEMFSTVYMRFNQLLSLSNAVLDVRCLVGDEIDWNIHSLVFMNHLVLVDVWLNVYLFMTAVIANTLPDVP